MNIHLPTAPFDADELRSLLGATQSADFNERRSEPRHPFFAPVTLRVVERPSQLLSAFSREISQSGIGLLHNMPIERGTTVAEGAVLQASRSAQLQSVRGKLVRSGWPGRKSMERRGGRPAAAAVGGSNAAGATCVVAPGRADR